jgi:hypothetical protein
MEHREGLPLEPARWSAASLADRVEVEHVLFTYLECLDSHDVAGFLTAFAADGEITVDYRSQVETYRGTDRLREFVEGRGGNAFHITTDSAVAVDGDRATRWARFVGFPADPADGRPTPNWLGRSIDELIRHDDGWKIARRRIWVVQGGGSPSWDAS